MNLNYTCICHYCGSIYKSNRSTSKYCCKQHNSLFHTNGSRIDFYILNNNGEYEDYHEILSDMYKTWTQQALYRNVKTRFYYDGPKPKANELLLVSGFIIKKPKPDNDFCDIAIKPMELLTKEERACSKILLPDSSYFNDY